MKVSFEAKTCICHQSCIGRFAHCTYSSVEVNHLFNLPHWGLVLVGLPLRHFSIATSRYCLCHLNLLISLFPQSSHPGTTTVILPIACSNTFLRASTSAHAPLGFTQLPVLLFYKWATSLLLLLLLRCRGGARLEESIGFLTSSGEGCWRERQVQLVLDAPKVRTN